MNTNLGLPPREQAKSPSELGMHGHTQDEWSCYWLEWQLQKANIPKHEEEIKLFLVYICEKLRLLEYEIHDLKRPWWRRWFR